MNIRHTSIALAAAFALGLSPLALAAEKGAGKPVTIKLAPQSGSGESGTAKLTPLPGSKTKVEIRLKGGPKGVAQPAHIHEGGCANLDPKPKLGLENVENGKSTTTVPANLKELLGGNMAINVHKSAQDLNTYVACGDIKAASAKK